MSALVNLGGYPVLSTTPVVSGPRGPAGTNGTVIDDYVDVVTDPNGLVVNPASGSVRITVTDTVGGLPGLTLLGGSTGNIAYLVPSERIAGILDAGASPPSGTPTGTIFLIRPA